MIISGGEAPTWWKAYAAGRADRGSSRGSARRSALTPNAGLAAVTGLCDQLGVIGALDAAVGPIKQRERGFGAGELLAGLAAARWPGRTS